MIWSTAMLYTGAWCDAIVRNDVHSSVSQCGAFERHFGRRGNEGGHWSALQAGRSMLRNAPRNDPDHPRQILGILVDREIRAIIEFAPLARRIDRQTVSEGVFEAAIWVEADWRRQRMGFALLINCTTILRTMGTSCLLLNCLSEERALRHLAEKFSADFTFAGHDCQAWIALGNNLRFPAMTHE
jgi:GNAT superfamily N-acetyltransferase